MNYNFDMHGKWVPKYLDKWIKEEKDMSAKFTFREVDYYVDVPEGVIITLRNIAGGYIPDKLSTRKEVDFDDMYRFFSKLVLHQLHHEGYRIVGSNDVASTYPEIDDRGKYHVSLSWKCNIPEIKNVIYNMPATIVEWSDGTKTVSKCEDGEIFDREKGLMAAYMQKMESINGRKLWKTLNKWLPKGLDMDNEPVNENMSMYVQSPLSRIHEKNCKKLNKPYKQTKSVAEVWDSLPKDVKEAAESKIAEAVDQADIDDDRTKEPALEKKDQLNQEFDKLMNPPVDPHKYLWW